MSLNNTRWESVTRGKISIYPNFHTAVWLRNKCKDGLRYQKTWNMGLNWITAREEEIKYKLRWEADFGSFSWSNWSELKETWHKRVHSDLWRSCFIKDTGIGMKRSWKVLLGLKIDNLTAEGWKQEAWFVLPVVSRLVVMLFICPCKRTSWGWRPVAESWCFRISLMRGSTNLARLHTWKTRAHNPDGTSLISPW